MELIKQLSKYTIEEQFEIKEDFESCLISYRNKKYLCKHFFDAQVMYEELYRYHKLKKCNISVPKLIKVYKKDQVCVFEHISGENMAVFLSKQDIPDNILEQLFTQYRLCRQWKIDLNYLPENFIFDGKYLRYISNDLYNTDKTISLDNYGIDFWLPTNKAKEHLGVLGLDIDKSRILSPAEAKKKIVLISVLYW